MSQSLAIDQFTEVLVGGQQDRAVLLGERKDLLVIRPGYFFRYRNNLAASKA